MEKVNLAQKFSLFSERYSPKIVGELNGSYVKVVKLQGDFMWHHHDNEDELFFVAKGELRMKLREDGVEREIVIRPASSSSFRAASSIFLPLMKRRTSCCWSRRARSIPATCRMSEPSRSYNGFSAGSST